MIQYDNTLNPKVKEIFKGWFESYSDHGRMNPEQCADFIDSCTNDHCQPNDRRIAEFFSRYDDDKDSYLTWDNFLLFYFDGCMNRPEIVWNNIQAHRYARNLKKKSDYPFHINSHINLKNDYVEMLFSLLKSEDTVAIKALELLNRLPTNHRILADIISLKGIRDIPDSEKPDWSNTLDKNNVYLVSYCLNIINYLLDLNIFTDNEAESEELEILGPQDPRLLQYRETWSLDFLTLGGFEHLKNILKDLLLKSGPIVDPCKAHLKSIILRY